MEKFKFILLSVVVLTLLGLMGYWAINSLQSGSEYVSVQKITELTQENDSLRNEIKDLTSQLGTLQAKLDLTATVIQDKIEPVSSATPVVYKYQDSINDLQNLIDKNVFLKLGSKGSSVGIAQKFLNIYNNTSTKIDNDYGDGMKKSITAFQKTQGLTADGEIGANTFKKMIVWLKTQN